MVVEQSIESKVFPTIGDRIHVSLFKIKIFWGYEIESREHQSLTIKEPFWFNISIMDMCSWVHYQTIIPHSMRSFKLEIFIVFHLEPRIYLKIQMSVVELFQSIFICAIKIKRI